MIDASLSSVIDCFTTRRELGTFRDVTLEERILKDVFGIVITLKDEKEYIWRVSYASPAFRLRSTFLGIAGNADKPEVRILRH